MVHLTLLGGFNASLDGNEITDLSSKKAQALLTMLACNQGAPITRDKLATLLWPDNAIEFSKTNLRQCLATIRKIILISGGSAIEVSRNSVSLNTELVSSDFANYEAYIADASIESLERAVYLYNGSLIDGLNIDSAPFHDWLIVERQRLDSIQQTALSSLLEHYQSTQDGTNENRIANKLLCLDPANEIAHEAKMRFFVSQGRRSDALAQFKQCESLLKKDLAIEPGASIKTYYDSIAATNWNNQKEPNVNTNKKMSSGQTASGKKSVFRSISNRKLSLVVCLALPVLALLYFAFDSYAPSQNEIASHTSLNTHKNLVDLSQVQRNSIAVLPFVNLSNDEDQQYFSDGLSEDLITDLSRASNLFVIARRSSFTYREKSPNISKIANELNVQYILVGNVRVIGERIRINAQLVDASTGTNLWANRYDRKVADVFEIQDEISRAIVGQLAIKLTGSDQQRFEKIRHVDPDAYDLLLSGLGPIRRLDKQSSIEAREIFKRAIEIDPSYARAYANLGLSYAQGTNFDFSDDKAESLRLASEALAMAEKLDPTLPQLYFSKTILALGSHEPEAAIEAAYRAVELDPNYADGYGNLAQALLFTGDYENAKKAMHNAKLLNPKFTFSYLWVEGQIDMLEGNLEKAVAVFEEINERNPAFISGRTLLISTLGHLGRVDDAEWEIDELLVMKPKFNLATEAVSTIFQLPEQVEYYIAGLRKAGIPE